MINPGVDGGGPAGSTDWSGWDVTGMWRMLAGQDTAAHWRQVAGWRKTYELTQMHLTRLRDYRERLSVAWPPERSAAAREYLDRLDRLIASVAQTHEVASANFTTTAAATGAIDAARAELKKIHDEYAPKRQLRDTFAQQAAALATVGYQPWRKPPVSDAELTALDERARVVMAGLSNELVQAQAQIRQPTTYAMRIPVDRDNPDVYGPAGPPPIPSIVPMPTSTAPLRKRVNAISGGGPTSGATSLRPVSGPGLAGPVLGGVGPGTPGPPAEPALRSSHVLTPPSTQPASPIGAVEGLIPPLVATGPIGGSDRPGLTPARPLARTGVPAPEMEHVRPTIGSGAGPVMPRDGRSTIRPLPPGGVIGGLPPVAGGTPAAGAPTRRVNPVGGVLQSGGAGTGPVGRAGQRPLGPVGRSAISGQPNASPSHRSPAPGEARLTHREWDPENPWEIDLGVPPVVLPPPPPGRIDPGPALGLDP